MNHKAAALLLAVTSCIGCRAAPSAGSGLAGVWQVQEIEVTSSNGSTVNRDPQPGQAIFTGSHYSLVWMPAATGLRAFEQRWVPTDAEKIQRYGEIVVNSGAYVMDSDSLITLSPLVSRVPEFMGGGRMLYRFCVAGDTLWLTSLDEYSFDGVQAPWASAGARTTLRLTRIEAVANLVPAFNRPS